jgi:hypothetical protein
VDACAGIKVKVQVHSFIVPDYWSCFWWPWGFRRSSCALCPFFRSGRGRVDFVGHTTT